MRIAGAVGLLALLAGCAATVTPAPNPEGPTAPTSSTTAAPPFSTVIGAPITVVPPETSTAPSGEPTTVTTSTEPSSAAPAETLAEPTVVETTVTSTPAPRGTVVVIDPGHNGGNAANPAIINKPVPAGFGQTKACNTTGTATDAGFAEHAFNWQVAGALRDLLTERGIDVVMTRDSDNGVGPCVDQRAAVGNDANAAAVISIHGDGGAASVSGFFVMTSSHEPGGPQVAAETDLLATGIRDSMVAAGFRVSNAIGKDGLWARGDLGGLNLSLVPSVMIELGNMRNPDEAAFMASRAGQQRYAAGIADGVIAFLAGHQAG